MTEAKYKNPFMATMNGIIDLFRKQTPIGELNDTERLDGKTCLVTGANSGLGYAIAVQLLERGAFVYLACRSQINETQQRLSNIVESKQFEILSIDLSDFNSINLFIDQLSQKNIALDVAIFNAAMVPSGANKLASGLDEMFQVNYLSKFYLVNSLLNNNLIPSAARIIFISSESHRTNKAIDFQNLGIFEEYNMGKVIELYGYYKLVLNTFAVQLSRRLSKESKNIDVFAMCPGPVNSNIARKAPAWVQPILKGVFTLFFSSPEKAAKPAIYLACAKDISGRENLYLHLMQDKAMDDKALKPTNGIALWQRSEELLAALKI
ncbi:SDR family NAD(P)-dependent oxidoreductase [Chitinophagales bacterium]|nr:SDR family NAD(P)-dependent oxidoreductase [Chitinophagales bacterium]